MTVHSHFHHSTLNPSVHLHISISPPQCTQSTVFRQILHQSTLDPPQCTQRLIRSSLTAHRSIHYSRQSVPQHTFGVPPYPLPQCTQSTVYLIQHSVHPVFHPTLHHNTPIPQYTQSSIVYTQCSTRPSTIHPSHSTQSSIAYTRCSDSPSI